jgi:phthiocerol/phenolphthiocerol synthesis type-I polyketide synthase D
MSPSLDVATIERWLVEKIAEELGVDASTIDTTVELSKLGLDSAQAVVLSGDLGRFLGVKLAATLVWDYPTIAELAAHVATLTQAA